MLQLLLLLLYYYIIIILLYNTLTFDNSGDIATKLSMVARRSPPLGFVRFCELLAMIYELAMHFIKPNRTYLTVVVVNAQFLTKHWKH